MSEVLNSNLKSSKPRTQYTMESPYISRFDVAKHLATPIQTWDAAEVEPQPNVKGIYLEGAPCQGKPTRIFAWVGLPPNASKEHPVPGIVLIHGGGGTAFAHWVSHWNSLGYAAISMDTCGSYPAWSTWPTWHPSWPRHEFAGPSGWGCFDEVDKAPADQWVYHAAASVLRATAYLKGLDCVDASNVGVGGISWGGFLTLVATAIAPKDTYRFAIPGYASADFARLPSCCIFGNPKITREMVRKWTDLWDPKPALKGITTPMLFLTDAEDLAFPLPTWVDTVEGVGGPRQRSMRIDFVHDHEHSLHSKTEATFADAVVHGKPLPVWGEMELQGTTVRCPFAFEGRHVYSAELCYTRSEGLWADRKWRATPARESGDGILSAELAWGANTAFFHVTDDYGCQWSSPVLQGIATPNDLWETHG